MRSSFKYNKEEHGPKDSGQYQRNAMFGGGQKNDDSGENCMILGNGLMR